jgi:hypothetical protein
MLEDLLSYIGVENIKPAGDEVQGRCPKHEERTGAREQRTDHWSINRNTGTHFCFSCEFKGSLVRLIMDMIGVGIWEAQKLIIQFDVELSQDEQPWEPPSIDLSEHLETFGPPPRRALADRKLKVPSVQRFGVRWDADGSAWVLPIVGPTGAVWGYQTKGPDQVLNHPPGIKKSRTLFGLNVLRGLSARTLLVESPLDAVYLDGLGYRAMASFGASVSDHQLRLLVETCDHLVLALDHDEAGIRATEKILRDKWHHRLPITVFDYGQSKAKDPGEMDNQAIHDGARLATLASFWSP